MSIPPRRPVPAEPWRDPSAQPFLRIQGISRSYGTVHACDDVSLDIHRGEFFALLGGSGSGKSTLLRVLAGLEKPDRGRVLIDGVDVTGQPPYARPVNMMFQSYALFPHMTVEQNIAFGLKQERLPAVRIRERVSEMLELVRMPELARRRPEQLSGGQRQRVALARALARQPKILLLDEPLGALDKRLREHTRFELMNIQQRVGTTFVMVTHDQEEAMTMASRVAVMDAGRIVQVSEPSALYEYPATRFVAEFIGEVNLFEGRIASQDRAAGLVRVHCEALGGEILAGHAEPISPGTAVAVAVRPEKIEVREQPPQGVANVAMGRVSEIAYLGDVSIYQVRTGHGAVIRVQETHAQRSSEPHYDRDDVLYLSWDAASAIVLTS